MTPATALVAHRTLLRVAFGAAHIFAWLFIFQYFYAFLGDAQHALARAALLYALSQVITCLLTPYAASQIRHGARQSLRHGALCAALGFIVLAAAFKGVFDAS